MGISGTQKALMYALGGKARGGATRGGYVNGRAFVTVAGVDVTASGQVEKGSVTVIDDIDEAVNTCTLKLEGIIANRGDEIIMTLGSKNRLKRLFGGYALHPKIVYLNRTAIGSDVTGNDYSALLKGVLVTGHYVGQTATFIISDLFAASPTGCTRSSDAVTAYSTSKVQRNLPVVNEITFAGTPLDQALSQVMDPIGEWTCDYHRVIHAFEDDEPNTSPPRTLNASHPTLDDFTYDADDGQVANRCDVEGKGAKLLGAVLAGDTKIPLDAVDMFEASGELASVSPGWQDLTFTGVVKADESDAALVGSGGGPSTAPVYGGGGGGGGQSDGIYLYAYSFVTLAGETLVSPILTIHDIAGLAVIVNAIAVGPTGTTARKLYRSVAGGTTLKLVTTIADNTTTTYTDGTADGSLGATAPISDSSGLVIGTGRVLAGATTLPVVSVKPYQSGGGWVFDGQQAIRYTGISGLTLTGVPANGTLKTGAAPETAPIFGGTSGAGSQVAGAYSYAVTFITGIGESLPSPLLVMHNAGSLNAIINDIAPGPAGTTKRGVYRSVADGSQLKLLVTINDNSTTTYTDAIADGSLGANVPTADTSGLLGVSGDAIGAINKPINYGATLTACSMLTGIPATGTGAIVEDLLGTETVSLLIREDDTAQQAAIAARYTTSTYTDDGIRAMRVQDSSLSIVEARVRARAEIDRASLGVIGITYTVKDPNQESGLMQAVNLDLPAANATVNVTGSFRTRKVTWTDIAVGVDEDDVAQPTCQVEASNQAFTFAELVRQRQGVA